MLKADIRSIDASVLGVITIEKMDGMLITTHQDFTHEYELQRAIEEITKGLNNE